eukprot:gene7641-7843_t
MSNKLSEAAAARGKDVSAVFDNRIPPFHEEFAKSGRWPSEADRKVCTLWLWEAYETARSLPLQMNSLMTRGSLTPEVFYRRMDDQAGLRWLCTVPFGAVRFGLRHPYCGAYQSYTNTFAKPELRALNASHISAGFVDLGSLAASCELHVGMSGRPASDIAAWKAMVAAAGGPMRWVGYDISAYAVAKTLVLLEMVQQDATADQLLQAWYSAAWSNCTCQAFRSALTKVLLDQQQAQQQGAPSKEVLSILQHWHTHNISLAASRSKWLDSQPQALTYVANFKRKADRLALCRYIMTGQLLEADVGSVMMFAVPEGHRDRALRENVLQTLGSRTLLQQVARGGARGPDIMEVAVGMLRRQVESLVGLLKAGAVTAEVHLGAVEPRARSTISAIRALKPYTISWSNIPDYLEPYEFHQLARAVSADRDTVHYMHSMNWVKDVKGCSHIDFMLNCSESQLPKMMPYLLQNSKQTVADMYKSAGLSGLLLSPPVDHPGNIIDCVLCTAQTEAWVSAFFDAKRSGISDMHRQVKVVEEPDYSVLSRALSTMHISFTYDANINFAMMPVKG